MELSFPCPKTTRTTRPPRSIIACLALTMLALFFFTGCASTGSNGESSALDQSPGASAPSDVAAGKAKKGAGDSEDNLSPSEGDIALESEMKALARSGAWGKKDQEQPCLEKMLDTSKYDFPVVLNNQVAAYLNLFQGEQHDMFGRWLARSSKYLPMIQRELAKAGLPQDLAYLSMIESGYIPTARSSAGAVGLWQFMPETGRHYTLRIDNYIDERRHIEKSTKAAVAMLGDLYRDFGDWQLAVAAYNGGPARVQNGLDRFGAKTFWALADEQYLPLETKRYVPKLIAAIIIAKDPKKYGFPAISYQPEFSYDRLAVTPGLTLEAVALVSGSSASTIRELNPELHKGVIPPNSGPYMVRIPTGSKELASRNLALLRAVRDTRYHHHVVKRRENMTTICKHYGVSSASLLKINNLRSARLTPGSTLLIPYTVTSYALGGKKPADNPTGRVGTVIALKTDKTKAGAASDMAKSGKTITGSGNGGRDAAWYLVKDGETLWDIAKKHNVSAGQIKKWNDLKSNAIHAGLRLRVSEA